jgi:hypothetical protein
MAIAAQYATKIRPEKPGQGSHCIQCNALTHASVPEIRRTDSEAQKNSQANAISVAGHRYFSTRPPLYR